MVILQYGSILKLTIVTVYKNEVCHIVCSIADDLIYFTKIPIFRNNVKYDEESSFLLLLVVTSMKQFDGVTKVTEI